MLRRALLCIAAVSALTVSGCAEEREPNKAKPAPGFGYELALARDAGAMARPQVIDLSVAQVRKLIAEGNVRLIDVRTDEEVSQGIIPGAEHIPLDRFDSAVLDLSGGGEIVLYCRSGRRSAIAGMRLAEKIRGPVKHLQGGYLAWLESAR